MTKLEKLYSFIENSRDLGVRLDKGVLQQVEEMEEKIIKEEILPALSNDIAPRLEPIKRDLVLVVEYHPGEPISVALSRARTCGSHESSSSSLQRWAALHTVRPLFHVQTVRLSSAVLSARFHLAPQDVLPATCGRCMTKTAPLYKSKDYSMLLYS